MKWMVVRLSPTRIWVSIPTEKSDCRTSIVETFLNRPGGRRKIEIPARLCREGISEPGFPAGPS
jgi:hypothetical protein